MKKTGHASARNASKDEVSSATAHWLTRFEFRIVCLLILLAGCRIFLFIAAFPPINNVDEQAHLDLVWKYRDGRIPTKIGVYNRDAAEQICLYGSPEYLPRGPFEEEMRAGKLRPPLYRHPEVKNPQIVRALVDLYIYPRADPANPNSPVIEYTNHEDTQPPAYYFLAGLWLRLGQLLGIHGGFLFYWIRFLNIPLLMGTVAVAYLFAKKFYPESPWIRIGAPLLVAFFPQDIFFAINNDVPSALFLGGALYLGMDLYFSKSPGYGRCAAAGLLGSAAFLTKQNNYVGLVILLSLGIMKGVEFARQGRLKSEWGRLGTLAAAAILPALSWAVRNQVVLGDWTGAQGKIEALGWVRKPFADLWGHPIFSPAGLWHFTSKTMTSLWKGEFVWGPGWREGTSALALPAADMVYLFTSLVFVGAAIFSLVRRNRTEPDSVRTVNLANLATLTLMFSLLAAVSIAFDFRNCFYPSQAEPYMTSGRLLLGSLIPFVLLYLSGMQTLLPGRKGEATRIGILLAMVMLMIGSQIYVYWPIFASQYNWFHMF